MPYVLTNCHNSLCAVDGTINEDDHLFGLSAARKYGGIYVPAHQAVIHQYMREMHAACGAMILGSDSHTRYGALGAMGVGEGGPELVKQLLGKTYDLPRPEVIAVYLEGASPPGVGPQDVALALIKAVFASGFVKNKVLEFVGPGVAGLSVDYRLGIEEADRLAGRLKAFPFPGVEGLDTAKTGLGGAVAARKPGDGSAREQAASCQKVLGGWANIALEYATKRYRSNLVNWGMLPFIVDEEVFGALEVGDLLYLPGARQAVQDGTETVEGFLIKSSEKRLIALRLPGMAKEEREIVLAGCLINHYASSCPHDRPGCQERTPPARRSSFFFSER